LYCDIRSKIGLGRTWRRKKDVPAEAAIVHGKDQPVEAVTGKANGYNPATQSGRFDTVMDKKPK